MKKGDTIMINVDLKTFAKDNYYLYKLKHFVSNFNKNRPCAIILKVKNVFSEKVETLLFLKKEVIPCKMVLTEKN